MGSEKGEMEAESTTAGGEILIDSILSAEMRSDSNSDSVQTVEDIDAMPVYSWNAVCSQLSHTVVDWALAVPHFTELSSDDQLMTLKAGIYPWHEITDKGTDILLKSSVNQSINHATDDTSCVSLKKNKLQAQAPFTDG